MSIFSSSSPLSHHRLFKNSGINGRHLYQFLELESTNNFAKKHIDDFQNGDVIWAVCQTQGKGRQGRVWQSQPERGLTFTVFIHQSIKDIWRSLSQIAAIALCDLLKEYKINAQIKWPNDILVKEKKISGILLESTDLQSILLGMGINVNSDDVFLRNIKQKSTSVKKEIGKEISLIYFLEQYLKYLESYLDILIERGFTVFKQKWQTYSNLIGKEIQVNLNNKKQNARVIDLLDDGGLLIKVTEGAKKAAKEKVIYSGEVFLYQTK